MSKERYLNTKFWDDNYIIEKDPIEKLIFLYLLTNTLTNIIGIYEISINRIAFDTGIDKDMVTKILERFEADDRAKYENGWIALKNFTKHQKNNPKINKGIEILTNEVPLELLRWVNIDKKRFNISMETMKNFSEKSKKIDYDRLSHPNPNPNPNSNTNSNKKENKIRFNFIKKEFTNLTKERMEEFDRKYPGVDTDQEIERMENWLMEEKEKKDKGEKNKIPKNYGKFMHNWLRKEEQQ
ncbi:hypothetical protein ES708_11203 [subsurface metagenome]